MFQFFFGELIVLYEELGKIYDVVISIYLFSGISGIYNSVVLVNVMVDYIKVYFFDLEISCLV